MTDPTPPTALDRRIDRLCATLRQRLRDIASEAALLADSADTDGPRAIALAARLGDAATLGAELRGLRDARDLL